MTMAYKVNAGRIELTFVVPVEVDQAEADRRIGDFILELHQMHHRLGGSGPKFID